MTVLEEKITIHAGGHEPTKQTGEAGAKARSVVKDAKPNSQTQGK